MPLPDGGRDEAAGAARSVRERNRRDDAAAPAPAEPALDRLLGGLLEHTGALTGSASGAISVIEAGNDRYTKAAERGIACRVGASFPLDEGATGRAVALRRPLVLHDYAELRNGHLSTRTAAGHRSVLAVPAWWRGEVIAVNVVFRPPGTVFSTAEVDAVESLTQVLAPALRLVRNGLREPGDHALAAALRRSSAAGRTRVVVTETGPARPVTAAVLTTASDVISALDRSVGGAPAPLRVGVVHRDRGIRLLLHREGDVSRADVVLDSLRAAVGSRTDTLVVEDVPGWGLAVQVDLPAAPPTDPLTVREHEVLHLVRQGFTDRAIAATLGRSAKTVEKHVGALMRKTGTPNRTAAVATAIERGWLAS